MHCIRLFLVQIVRVEGASKLANSEKTLSYRSFEFTLIQKRARVVEGIRPSISAI